jgi:primosomal protein N' (replication factor Y)
MPALAAIVVIDEHDEVHQEERVPCWHARDVAVERARRAGVPCVLVSPTPSLEALAELPVCAPSRDDERRGWPILEVVDRSREDPAIRSSLVSAVLARHIRDGRRVACVLNTTGRARITACASCRTLARCERCQAALAETSAAVLACRRCGLERPLVCAVCGASRFKVVRAGTARLRDDLAALAGEEVV